jgi:drug/metabolite transporter (DMT)-like permease
MPVNPMIDVTEPVTGPKADPALGHARQITALIVGNIALALGPWSVRLADTGPVSAGFWRLVLALPLLFLLARANRQRLSGFSGPAIIAIITAGVFFALDLASWHIGIDRTRLGNAALLGNSGSIIIVAWGLVVLRRLPHRQEWLALFAAICGSAILMGRSLEIDGRTFAGDLFCLLAGMFYAGYIVLLQNARERLGSWSLLALSSLIGAPVMLVIAVLLGEPLWPGNWWPLLALALGSQVIGQGLLVYALRHFSPLVIGLAMLTQPGIAVLAGWWAFGEALGWIDALGMALVAGALVLAKVADRA